MRFRIVWVEVLLIYSKDGPPGERSTLLSSQGQLTLVGLASSAQRCLVMELRLSICKEKL